MTYAEKQILKIIKKYRIRYFKNVSKFALALVITFDLVNKYKYSNYRVCLVIKRNYKEFSIINNYGESIKLTKNKKTFLNLLEKFIRRNLRKI
jgi:hypothetical protein